MNNTLHEQIREYNEIVKQCKAILVEKDDPIVGDTDGEERRNRGHRKYKELQSLVADMKILRRKMVVTHCPTKAPADPYILHRDKRYRYSELTLYKRVSLEEK